MARLTSIHVGGFKSIKNLPQLSLHNVNVFVGANGAGKSNLLSFFRLLNAIPAGKLQEFVSRAGGGDTLLYYGSKETRSMFGELGFEDSAGVGQYAFVLVRTETDSLVFSTEEIGRLAADTGPQRIQRLGSGHRESPLASEGLPYQDLWNLLAGSSVYHFEDTSETAAVRRRGNIEDNRRLRGDAGNLAAILYALRETRAQYYRRIVATIRQVAPFFEDFELAPRRIDPNSIQLNWRDRDSTNLFGPHQLSDGTLRTMALVALLGQPESELPPVIVLDEPEIGLHPYALEIVASLIKSASVHSTVIVATQSVGLVNQFAPEDIVTVTRDKAESKFERQNSETLAAWLQDYAIGEIWERNLIGGTPSR